jgi:hypothetical protein
VIKDLRLPLLKSKQIMRKYFASRKESIDEEWTKKAMIIFII